MLLDKFTDRTNSIPVRTIELNGMNNHLTYTRTGEPRGYVDSQQLTELWVHTGTVCNLSCPFCLEGSKPGDDRLGRMQLKELKPYFDTAVQLGVEKFSFTGGEPFVIRDMINILTYAATLKPCLVLTNGTDPLLRRAQQLDDLRSSRFPISFRISLDYSDETLHDQGRGAGSFAKSLRAIKLLLQKGFSVSLARQITANENITLIENAYHELLKQHGIPASLAIIGFPDFSTPGKSLNTPEITETCMEKFPTKESQAHFMCANSRMLVKQNQELRVYACTLVDDDTSYDLGTDLAESMKQRIMLRHHRCFSCYRYGASCSEK